MSLLEMNATPCRDRNVAPHSVASATSSKHLEGADDDGQTTSAERIGQAGEEQAQRPGEAQNSLADGHFGEDEVDETSRGQGQR